VIDSIHMCRRCGAPLDAEVTRGLCPVCLLESTLLVEQEPAVPEAVDTAWLERNRLAGEPNSGTQPHRLGDYELLEEIGRGGMGVIYRARQISLDRLVAVKTILTGPLASPDFVQRFQTEAHAAAVLDHPNIVPIYEVGNHQGQPFYSMRLVPGRNLAQELKETGAMPPRRGAELLATVARAVHYAHQRGVLHRDLKPANILLDHEGNPHVTDFGLAKLLEQDDGLTLTQAALGTPNYMAPEQAAGEASQLTTAADVYSLGAILFEVLTGKKLFTASTPLATINRARDQEPPKPSAILRTVPRDLDTICWKCLEKEPQRRYASALGLAEDLQRWLAGEPIRARRVGTVERIGLWCRRKPAMAGMAGMALLAVLVVSGIAAWRLSVARQQKQLEQYAGNISLADSYIRDGATDRAMELLLQCPSHLRHWEWGRLVYLCHQEIATIYAHTNRPRWLFEPLIQRMDLNHDATRLLSRGLDGDVKLWDPRQPSPLVSRGGPTNEVLGWDFAPDGHRLILGMADGTVEMLDAATGLPVWVVLPQTEDQRTNAPIDRILSARRVTGIGYDPGNQRPIYDTFQSRPESAAAVCFFRDGRRIAVGTGGRDIILRDAATGAETGKWRHHLEELKKLWFAPDGSRLVAKGALAVELIDSESGETKETFSFNESGHSTFFVDRSGRNAASFDADGFAHLWHAGKKVHSLPVSNPEPNFVRVFFDFEGRRLCLTGKATVAGVYEAASSRLVFSVPYDVNGGAFSPRGDRLVTFGPDRVIRLWDLAQGREVRVLLGHSSVPELSVFSPDGQVIATATRDGVIKLWTGWPGRELVQSQALPAIGPYTQDGRSWATALSAKGIYEFDADSGRMTACFPLRKTAVSSLAYSPDGRFLATVGHEKVARIWDLREHRLTGLLREHDRVIICVAWSADGKWVATGDLGGVAGIWEAPTRREWKKIKAHDRNLSNIQFHPAGHQLLTSGYGPPRLWDIQTGNLIRALDDEGAGSPCAVFSSDGRWVASPGVDRQIRIWEVASGRLIAHWPSRSQGFAVCGFSPDSRRLVVCVVDYATGGFAAPFLEIWDTERGRHLLDLRGHRDSIFGAIFRPQGDRILTASMDRTARQWETFPWRDEDYAEFPGKALAERIGAYAGRYWKQRIAVEQAGGTPETMALVDTNNPPMPREWESILRPARASGTSSNLLNLDAYYTGPLDSVFRPEGDGWEGDDDLSRLPKGVVTLGGIPFDVRGVVLLRRSKQMPYYWWCWLDYPARVNGIPIGRSIRQLHVLHATVGQVASSALIGSYILHYADGSQHELEIIYGRDLRDWWLGGRGDPETAVTHARVAWTGSNPIAEEFQAQVRLFLRTYENPRPEAEVVSVDFVSKQTTSAPFLVAMTVE
jgi:eukaryotic-like serine/threonine-protein kinase